MGGVRPAAADTDRAAQVGLRRALEVLLSRAQRAGAVRDDLRVQDLIGLLVGAARAAEHLGQDAEAQARITAVILDGLRPTGTRHTSGRAQARS
jgi:hypothetical protein